ncbi:MAG: TPM domain-containing protein [bacterium]|jgi:uncharacterized membrane protein|nr:TPM domain-containing protein [bacterium]
MARSDKPAEFLTAAEQEQVRAAVAEAERGTSGEIRVYLERRIPWFGRDPYRRARRVFVMLGMHETEVHNGVLVYLATASHRFAIVGDERLHQIVGDLGWHRIADAMTAHFAADRFGDGLAEAVRAAGGQLAEYFPRHPDDVNELPDEIHFGR